MKTPIEVLVKFFIERRGMSHEEAEIAAEMLDRKYGRDDLRQLATDRGSGIRKRFIQDVLDNKGEAIERMAMDWALQEFGKKVSK